MKGFASDNYSGIHPEVIAALLAANNQHEISYGDDIYTEQANRLFREMLGDVDIYYCFNGTGANVVALKTCLLPFQAVVCAETAHINADECGAPTQSIGSSLLTIKTSDGKLTPELIRPLLSRTGNVHNTQPKVISISQSTELGTIYSVNELKTLCDYAHKNNMLVHMDGARISNAVAALGVSLKECTVDCGIDIMSFGGTKNGLMIGEAVLIFNEKLKENAPYFHKQTAQLFSKNRFIAAQYTALLNNDLWLKMAAHSNKMAQLLAQKVSEIKGVTITRPVQANAIFAIIPQHVVKPLQEAYRFYVWDESTMELRWMCSFDTNEEEVNSFAELLKKLIG